MHFHAELIHNRILMENQWIFMMFHFLLLFREMRVPVAQAVIASLQAKRGGAMSLPLAERQKRVGTIYASA